MASVIIEMALKCSCRTIEMASVIIEVVPKVFLEDHRDGLSDHRDGPKGVPKDHRDGS